MAGVSLLDFIGYGSRDPLVVFLGIEEKDAGGGACALTVRQTQFAEVEDVQRACSLLAQCPGFSDPFAPSATRTVPQWNMASRLRLALAGLPWQTDWDRHWRTYLGRSSGDTLLTECFADPAVGLHVPQERSQQWPKRRQVLQHFAKSISPKYVIAYGADPAKYVSEIFPATPSRFGDRQQQWHALTTRRPASISRTVSGTVVARVGFFGQGRFSEQDIDPIALAMRQLGSGTITLRHPWP